jgi:hypothetical protein
MYFPILFWENKNRSSAAAKEASGLQGVGREQIDNLPFPTMKNLALSLAFRAISYQDQACGIALAALVKGKTLSLPASPGTASPWSPQHYDIALVMLRRHKQVKEATYNPTSKAADDAVAAIQPRVRAAKRLRLLNDSAGDTETVSASCLESRPK